MTKIDVTKLRAKLAAATEGPWTVCRMAGMDAELVSIATDDVIGRLVDHDGPDGYTPDQALIISAVNALPALLDELEALRAAVKAADLLRQGIREAGVKRDPAMYGAVMSYDSARAGCGVQLIATLDDLQRLGQEFDDG